MLCYSILNVNNYVYWLILGLVGERFVNFDYYIAIEVSEYVYSV